MEKKNKLCLEILGRLYEAGILRHVVLIGSWSIYFYKYYFDSKDYSTFIRTSDIDLLVPLPARFADKTDVFELVKDLGFIESHRGSEGYLILKHPDLSIEFLVPERGSGESKPFNIPQLSVNAQPLRYLDYLAANTISVNADNLKLRLPHPAAFALHKFIVFKRRTKLEKHDRDLEGALRVMHELLRSNQRESVRLMFGRMHKKWQKQVLSNLKSVGELEIIELLT